MLRAAAFSDSFQGYGLLCFCEDVILVVSATWLVHAQIEVRAFRRCARSEMRRTVGRACCLVERTSFAFCSVQAGVVVLTHPRTCSAEWRRLITSL